jgi:hypothetical protein
MIMISDAQIAKDLNINPFTLLAWKIKRRKVYECLRYKYELEERLKIISNALAYVSKDKKNRDLAISNEFLFQEKINLGTTDKERKLERKIIEESRKTIQDILYIINEENGIHTKESIEQISYAVNTIMDANEKLNRLICG